MHCQLFLVIKMFDFTINLFTGFLEDPNLFCGIWFLFLSKPIFLECYTPILLQAVFSVVLSGLLILFSYSLVTQKPGLEKLSTYECGFEPYEDSKNKFDVQFYIVAILFVIFDIETIFLMPWCLSLSSLNPLSFWFMVEFFLEIGLSFIYIWSVKTLNW